MDLFDLEQGMKAVACGGNLLNCQEITGLQAGLTMLRCKEKFTGIYLWGKILGLKADYYVAYGMKDPDFEFPQKVFFFAGEDFEFKALPLLTEEVAEQILALDLEKPFTGQPDFVIEPPVEGEDAPDEGDGDEAAEGKLNKLTEKSRLMQLVQEIDFDTAVVPRGAHRLNEAHVVVPSADFRGLGLTEATSLSKYVHFRPPASIAALRALARTDAEFYASFLDPLDGDLPRGCWAVRQDQSASLVTLRSLSWPGYVAFHVPQTSKYGGLYFGYGQKSRDLPFML